MAGEISLALGGIQAVERALGVSKGVLHKRGAGRTPLMYEHYLAMEGLGVRLGIIRPNQPIIETE